MLNDVERLDEQTPKAKLSVQDRIYVNMGGEILTASPTDIAGTDVAHLQVLQEPAAEPFTSKFLMELMADVEELTKALIIEKNWKEQNEDFRTESSKRRADKVEETTGRIQGDCNSSFSAASHTVFPTTISVCDDSTFNRHTQ